MRKHWLAVVAALALSGCSMARDVPAATTAIDAFHAQLNAGRFDPLWQGASPDFKTASPEPAFVHLLGAVHRKLGLFKSGKGTGFNENVSPAGTFVTIGYASAYQRGQALEQFVYRMDSGRPTLAGYHVNSDALILN